MQVLLLTRYERLGSSSRVRFYQYLPYLRKHGLEFVIAPFFTDEYIRDLYSGRRASFRKMLGAYLRRLSILMSSRQFDLLWVEKELFPWLPAGVENLLHMSRIPYAVDYDDAVFHRYDMHTTGMVRAFLGHKIDGVMRHAGLVIAGNDYIANRAVRAGARNVEQLPSVVDVDQYTITESGQDPVFRIGWIGSPVTARYLDGIREVLTTLSQESRVKLILIGAGELQPFANVPVEADPWSEDIELRMSQKFDVGIMPLVDGPFERGKCGYKLIQYMASALPVVASPVGVNREIVESQVNGYLAHSSADWLAALRTLRDEIEKRKRMGQAGRRKAEQMYNLRVTAPRLLHLLSGLMKPSIS